MAVILIVDDEAAIRNVIREYAEYEGFETIEAADGLEAVRLFDKSVIDLIIMDIMMPRMDGFSAYNEIKKKKDVPVIMLSARSEEYDKLYGFGLGVEDYVVKPFSPRELMARVKVILNRNQRSQKTLDFEGLSVNISGRSVCVDSQRITMTPKEYDLLFFLVENKNIVFSRETLLMNVWGYEFGGEERTVDTHIKMLRHSLGNYRKLIITYRGAGYKFEV